MSSRGFRYVEGLYVGGAFSDENVRSAMNYTPVPEDLFVVSYPKCGSTWTQYLMYNIFSGAVPPKDFREFVSSSPFLEFIGAKYIEKMRRPGSIKMHLPFGKHRYSEQAKYLCIARNPYDCCVSYYHHTKSFPGTFFENGTFNEFLDMFLEGKVNFGEYFDNLLSWYDHRHYPNVLFMTYEDLKKNTEGCVLKMADFLGKEYSAKLRGDADALKSIIRASSVEAMKKIFTRDINNVHTSVSSGDGDSKNSSEYFDESVLAAKSKPMTGDFIRKGIVGDWRNHFSKVQATRMKNWISLRTADSDVMNIWKDEDLP